MINAGRDLGRKLEDAVAYLTTDSTYGSLDRFLYGYTGQSADVKILDRSSSLIEMCGIPIRILHEARNPRDISWGREGVRVVIDCTGVFLDPTRPADHPKGSLRGHLEAGADKVILSAPFKISGPGHPLPEDSATFVYGVNHSAYDPLTHNIISAASCTTTGLAHLIKPLLENEATANIMTASMSTIHAATNTQSILDSVPKAGATDLRKTRSVLNNIILSTTGAAKALELVMPQIKSVGFMADSVRIPTSTVSLINLNVTFHTELNELGQPLVSRRLINEIYKQAAEGPQKGLLVYSERQNVSADLIGSMAAATLEAHETHTRTSFIPVPRQTLAALGVEAGREVTMPVTHAKIFGWYDNELGSYTNSLSRLVNHIEASTP